MIGNRGREVALNARAHIAFAASMIVLSATLLGLAGIAFPMSTSLSVQQVISLPTAQDGVMPLRPMAHCRSAAFEGLLGSSPCTRFSSDHVVYPLEGAA
ncbi:MAG: hypothetical protein ABFE13_18570 [Phycisphaerales bacterium]